MGAEFSSSRTAVSSKPLSSFRNLASRYRFFVITITKISRAAGTHIICVANFVCLVGMVGFEPTTLALSRRCSNQLSYIPTALHLPHRYSNECTVDAVPSSTGEGRVI